MKCVLKVCVLTVLLYQVVVADRPGKPCGRCVPAQKCDMVNLMSRSEQEEWSKKYYCDAPREANNAAVPFGFASVAKGDYVCCPLTNSNKPHPNREPSIDSGAIVFDNGPLQISGQIRNSNQMEINKRIQRQQIDTSGTIDSISSQITSRPLVQNINSTTKKPSTANRPGRDNPLANVKRPTENGNMNNGNRPNYEFPTFGRDGRPIFNNQNSFDNQNGPQFSQQYQNQPAFYGNNEFGFTPPDPAGFDNTRAPSQQGRRRPTNVRSPRPPITDNPYFLPKNPNTAGNRRMGNPRVGNSFANGISGQCSALTSFPPDPNTGCCGRDPSDRITNPPAQPQGPAMLTPDIDSGSFFGGFMKHIFNFGDASRFKRADDLNITIDTRITGGKATELNQFPWLALLKTTFSYGFREAAFACGGSLISARYVLTAAHCVVEDGARVKYVEITLAEFDKRTFPTDCVATAEGRRCVENRVTHADTVLPHPQYDDSRLQNDIALLRLRATAPYTEFIRPICLAPIDVDSPEFSNIPLSVAGWGRDGEANSDVKQWTVVALVPQRECRRSYSQLTRRHLCAAGQSGQDTCKGDSGGPLMILYEGRYYVSGIVSGKRADSPCGTSVPSLYTNVYQYLDWINSNIRN
ncbi:uncharacterized protein LOC105389458 [Plutella xylostella]|uniref:uncharacterized protein LOC105389458 n=1 Tax=Plutella xylostella TaxID=51655 RepID=UPI00203230A7|nr:uncharacterized protein LOC105389458 [Plutella xylostella]